MQFVLIWLAAINIVLAITGPHPLALVACIIASVAVFTGRTILNSPPGDPIETKSPVYENCTAPAWSSAEPAEHYAPEPLNIQHVVQFLAAATGLEVTQNSVFNIAGKTLQPAEHTRHRIRTTGDYKLYARRDGNKTSLYLFANGLYAAQHLYGDIVTYDVVQKPFGLKVILRTQLGETTRIITNPTSYVPYNCPDFTGTIQNFEQHGVMTCTVSALIKGEQVRVNDRVYTRHMVLEVKNATGATTATYRGLVSKPATLHSNPVIVYHGIQDINGDVKHYVLGKTTQIPLCACKVCTCKSC